MGKPLVDKTALHWILWDRADSDGQLLVRSNELADELALDPRRMSQILKAMETRGMLERLSTRPQPAPITYRVSDPGSG